MSIALIREFWEYHHWANRRLFDVTRALGEEMAGRTVGAQFSEPSLCRMFVHMFGADRFWLRHWQGEPPGARGPEYGLDIRSMETLRPIWDDLISEQRRFLESLGDADLERTFEVRAPDGAVAKRTFGVMLLHVPNHATHHRSEIATMLTMMSGSPPETGIHRYYQERDARAEARR